MAESGLGLAALTKNQAARSRYTVGTFPRGSVSPRMAAVLDRLSLDPVTRDIGIVSGPRDTAYNKAAGGAAGSQHKYSNALDLSFKGLPDATKKHVTETLVAAGVSRFGLYASGAFHFDVRPGVGFWGALKDAYKGMTVKDLAKLPGWVRDTITGLVNGTIKPNEAGLPPFEKNLVDNKTEIQASLPVTMDAPLSLADTQLRAEAIARQAQQYAQYRPGTVPSLPVSMPSRPLSMTPVKALNALAPPSRLAPAPVGQVSRAPLGAALARPTIGPARENPPSLPSAARPTIGPARENPPSVARSLAHPVSAPKPSNLTAAPVGQVTRAPISPPDMSFTPSNPSQMGTAPASPQGNFSVPDAYAEMEANRAKAFSNMPPPAPPPAPIAPPTPPPVEQLPPAQVLAPQLVPNYVRPALPPAGLPAAPPAPPAATAYDVYSGLADSALDNTGLNTVSAMPGGGTSVTNQYGVTTGMTPGGYQTAVGNLPSLPGIKGPATGTIGKTVAKAAIPAVGGLFGGPLGGILGAVVASQLAKPGGLLGGPGLRTIDTMFGPIQAYQANRSLNSFPDRPSYGTRQSGFSSDGVRSAAYGMSPRAAADIDAGRGGLF